MQVGVTPKSRVCHSLTGISINPGLTKVVEFGGTPDSLIGSEETQPKMAGTTLLQFSEYCTVNNNISVDVPEPRFQRL